MDDFEAVRDALAAAGIEYAFAEITMLPQTTADLDDKASEQMFKLLDSLDDCDNAQKVYTNANLSDNVMEEG